MVGNEGSEEFLRLAPLIRICNINEISSSLDEPLEHRARLIMINRTVISSAQHAGAKSELRHFQTCSAKINVMHELLTKIAIEADSAIEKSAQKSKQLTPDEGFVG